MLCLMYIHLPAEPPNRNFSLLGMGFSFLCGSPMTRISLKHFYFSSGKPTKIL